MTSTGDFIKNLEYALWNNKIISSLYNLLDMYTPDEISNMYTDDVTKYGDK